MKGLSLLIYYYEILVIANVSHIIKVSKRLSVTRHFEPTHLTTNMVLV